MPSVVTIYGQITPAQSGGKTIGPLTLANVTSPPVIGVIDIALAASANVITVPKHAIGCVIAPPPASTVSLAILTNLDSGDAGLPIAPNLPTLYAFPTTIPTSLTIVAGATMTPITEITFF